MMGWTVPASLAVYISNTSRGRVLRVACHARVLTSFHPSFISAMTKGPHSRAAGTFDSKEKLCGILFHGGSGSL